MNTTARLPSASSGNTNHRNYNHGTSGRESEQPVIDQPWQGRANEILYALMFVEDLDDRAVHRLAGSIIDYRSFNGGPQAYSDTVEVALGQATDLTEAFDTPHDEASFRDFLTRLRARLVELRPWARPLWILLSHSSWPTLADARPVATLPSSAFPIHSRLGSRFMAVPGEDRSRRGVILQLASGEVVGLLSSYEPDTPVVLLQRDDGDPAATGAAFLPATGLSDQDINT